MNRQFTRLESQRLLFLIGITVLYTALIVWLDFLQGPYWWDESTFWNTSQDFSDRILPTLDDIRDYNELSTPLPFIIFGAIEHLFEGGIFAGRLLNIVLSISMVWIIGWPSRRKHKRAILCLAGLFLCPYYLWLSGRLYTEMIACFWVLLGFHTYVHKRYFWSSVAFVLAIASRQYMLAFPAAITVYELTIATSQAIRSRQIQLVPQRKWLLPLAATLSILGWFYLFQGMTPQTALEVRLAPDIQKTAWAVRPGGAVNFLAFVGAYLVIPELLLFWPKVKLSAQRLRSRQIIWTAIALLIYVSIFPPLSFSAGNVGKIANLLPFESLRILLFYTLTLLACIRFSRPNLLSIIVLMNSLLMVKAFPWDRYVLPLVVIFWYMHANNIEEKFSLFRRKG